MIPDAMALLQQAEKEGGSGPGGNSSHPAESAAVAPGMRTESFLFGIPQLGLTHVERQVSVDEPPPMPANADLEYIGKPTQRYDGVAKVSGQGKYTADVHLPGMLYARMIGASIPHGRILSIDTSAAERHPGVRAVHVVERELRGAKLRDPKEEIPSKYPIVRYAGQPVAAVAAITQAVADDAADLVKIQYAPVAFVVERQAAREPGAPLVFPGPADAAGSAGGGGGPRGVPQTGNVHGPQRGQRGNVEQGFAEADVIVEAEYFTQVQTHSALETHGVVADWRPDELTVYASTQGTNSVRTELSEYFKLPMNRVRVITDFMGGGFGAKFGAGNEGVMAVELSRKANAPVRLMLDRKQEHIVSNRPDSHQTLRIGAKKDGTLTAMHLVSYGTAGVGTGAGTAGPVQNLYQCSNLLTEENDVFINAGPGAAFRAPGHPPGCFALEQAIDELAEKLQMDALELRARIDNNPQRKVEREIVLERSNWKNRHASGADRGPVKRGMGVAQSVWYRMVRMNSSCEIRVARDGSVEVHSAVQDLGGGTKTILAQVVAEEFGIPPRSVGVRIGDTRYPIGPDSGGSVTAGSITPSVRNGAYHAKLKFLAAVAPALGAQAEDLVLRKGRVMVKSDPSRSWSLRQAAAKLPVEEIAVRGDRAPEYVSTRGRMIYGGVDYVEVAVDTETGRVHVEKVLGVHDCGRPINPLGVISQVNGGILQGISYALFEQRVMDPKSGFMLNANLENYKILGSRETPQIEVVLIENYIAMSSTDAAGIGESAGIITMAAAVGNAVYNALGVRVRRIPMTPATVLAALGKTDGELRA